MSKIPDDKKEKIKDFFHLYKETNISVKNIAQIFKISPYIVGKIFHEEFGSEYKKISKIKSYSHSIKINRSKLDDILKKYKDGKTLRELAEEIEVDKGTLGKLLCKKFGNEYKTICRANARRINYNQIKNVFDQYKSQKISLAELSAKLKITESTLISRFKNYFRDEYRKITISRRDERKVSKENYIVAFELYEKTSISLTTLANNLDIAISSLRTRFLRLFGERYNMAAKKKLNGNFLNRRGELCEELALEYLKILDIVVDDVREKCLIKDTLMRPDFISGENFIEVKSYFIKYSGKRLKGYKEILDSYLNKELLDGTILRFGIIISLEGFSEKVWKEALKDNITLIDYYDLINRFEEAKRYDLINLLETHFLRRCEI